MTARTAPDPIHDQISARVDNWVENALDPQACAAALRRVLDVARRAETQALRWQDQLPVPTWVGMVRAEIAAAFGLAEHPDVAEYLADCRDDGEAPEHDGSAA